MQIKIEGIKREELYTGSMLIEIVESLQREAGAGVGGGLSETGGVEGMKTRIKVKDGRYYPQYRVLGRWCTLRHETFEGLQPGGYYLGYYLSFQGAKDRIDRFLKPKPRVTYIEYP